MPSSREIKNRIRSVKNIGQITRALEAVSASRVRRAQARVLASRAYAEKAWEILLNVQNASKAGGSLHPLLTEREEIKQIMIILITSDRGLAGAFNTNIIRVAQRFADRMGVPVKYVTVGRKGRDALIRAGENVVAEFSDIPDDLSIADISPITRLAIDEFLSGEVDDVFIAYTDFINTLTQRPAVLGWLPLVPHNLEDPGIQDYIKDVAVVSDGGQDYEFEPGPEAILDEIVPRFTELMLYQAFLESKASEHSARMVAMRNASDNASQLVDDLTLDYNKARQSAITSEILDIVGGAEALQDSIDKAADDMLRKSNEAMASTPMIKPDSKRGPSDDLTKIEGIGPKMSTALKAAGIRTFKTLAKTEPEALRAAIEAAGMRLAPSLETWAEQATYAAAGDWEGLEKLQSELTAGRKA